MLRLKIELPKDTYHTVIRSRDEVANVLIHAMVKHGFQVEKNTAAKWGFGVLSTPTDKTKNLRRIGRVYVGSSDPKIAEILSKIEPKDLIEPNAMPGCGLNLSMAEITKQTTSLETEGIGFYCISPIRPAHLPQTEYELPAFGQPFNDALNLAMQHRFNREFHLSFAPDSLYVRAKGGNVTARMAHNRKSPQGVLTKPGLITPFVLTGPKEEIDIAYFSGLGINTGRGFGCIEVSL